MDENVLITLLKDAVLKKYRQKETVLQPGKCDGHIHLVLDGVVTLHTYTENGRQIINSYLGRGYFFGEVALTNPDAPDFLGELKGRLHYCFNIPGTLHRRRNVTPRFTRVLTDQLIGRLRAADHKARDLAFLDVSGRVANALQGIGEGSLRHHPSRGGMQIRMTRQEIGLIVGCSREMVGRAIKMLADQGDIEVTGENIVVRGTR